MDNRVELKKTLNPLSVWALALGSIVGFGCFVLPGDWLPKSGPMGAALAFIIGAIFMVVIAESYGTMVKNFPVAGGEFAYAYGAFGRNQAFICGWLLTLGYWCLVPTNGTALGVLGRFVAPGLFSWGHVYDIAGWEVYLGEILLGSVVMGVFGYFQVRGVEIMGKLQSVIVVLLCGSVALMTAGAFLNPHVTVGNLYPLFAPGKSVLASVAPLLAIAPFLYVGFDTIPQSAEEFAFSHDKTRMLMISAIIIGGLIYTASTMCTALAEPWQNLIAGKPVWATGQALHVSLGNFGVAFLLIAVTMAISSGINGFYMATSRLLFGMARAKAIPQWFAEVHPKYGTPHKAIIFTLVLSLIAPWFGRKAIIWIVDMCALGTAIGYLYTCLAAYRLFQTQSNMEGAGKGKFIAALGSLFSLVFLGLLVIPGSPAFLAVPSWIAMGVWLGMGGIFYMMKSKEYKEVPEPVLDRLILGDSAEQVGVIRGDKKTA